MHKRPPPQHPLRQTNQTSVLQPRQQTSVHGVHLDGRLQQRHVSELFGEEVYAVAARVEVVRQAADPVPSDLFHLPADPHGGSLVELGHHHRHGDVLAVPVLVDVRQERRGHLVHVRPQVVPVQEAALGQDHVVHPVPAHHPPRPVRVAPRPRVARHQPRREADHGVLAGPPCLEPELQGRARDLEVVVRGEHAVGAQGRRDVEAMAEAVGVVHLKDYLSSGSFGEEVHARGGSFLVRPDDLDLADAVAGREVLRASLEQVVATEGVHPVTDTEWSGARRSALEDGLQIEFCGRLRGKPRWRWTHRMRRRDTPGWQDKDHRLQSGWLCCSGASNA